MCLAGAGAGAGAADALAEAPGEGVAESAGALADGVGAAPIFGAPLACGPAPA